MSRWRVGVFLQIDEIWLLNSHVLIKNDGSNAGAGADDAVSWVILVFWSWPDAVGCYGSGGPNRCSYDLGFECAAQYAIALNLIALSRAGVADRYAASRNEA